MLLPMGPTVPVGVTVGVTWGAVPVGVTTGSVPVGAGMLPPPPSSSPHATMARVVPVIRAISALRDFISSMDSPQP